ncbi:PD40 domain-containing protein [Mobilitalea sibirica]|uniref:PD40 domain-containing protein n=1 Tax=Mobilitalea sibirica TaxID=1462919 RepID=A0A8J7KW08_9FIRM|nr:PD40 domain-containing protein [Mobilitalea sibirica]MBH1940795.1 PD40 domain-containing protein [Mobilitalea sibirica]
MINVRMKNKKMIYSIIMMIFIVVLTACSNKDTIQIESVDEDIKKESNNNDQAEMEASDTTDRGVTNIETDTKVSEDATEVIEETNQNVSDALQEVSLFAPDLIKEGDEFALTFAPDGKTVYYSRASRDYMKSDIYYSELDNGKWSEPQIASFSSEYVDFDPFMIKDGTKLFFVSNRPIDGKRSGYNIWMVEKDGEDWGDPNSLGDILNTPYNDAFCSIAENGNIYFCSDRAGGVGSYDIYMSRLVDGEYQKPENLGEGINTRMNDTDPLISFDESFLIFTRGDLYVSYNMDGEWSEPEPLDKVNTEAREYSPGRSHNGEKLFFAREQQGKREIYHIDFSALGLR